MEQNHAVSRPPPSTDQLKEAVKQIKAAMPPSAQNLLFSIDDATGETIIKLIDTQTKTVLRQIPSQEMLDIAHALDKLQGLLVKNKA